MGCVRGALHPLVALPPLDRRGDARLLRPSRADPARSSLTCSESRTSRRLDEAGLGRSRAARASSDRSCDDLVLVPRLFDLISFAFLPLRLARTCFFICELVPIGRLPSNPHSSKSTPAQLRRPRPSLARAAFSSSRSSRRRPRSTAIIWLSRRPQTPFPRDVAHPARRARARPRDAKRCAAARPAAATTSTRRLCSSATSRTSARRSRSRAWATSRRRRSERRQLEVAASIFRPLSLVALLLGLPFRICANGSGRQSGSKSQPCELAKDERAQLSAAWAARQLP